MRLARPFALLLAASFMAPLQALAAGKDAAFFDRTEGTWSGPGEIIAGKYKGTKFVCNFAGTPTKKSDGLTLDGTCRVGVFNQKMKATVQRSGNSYTGKFLDGAAGEGMDVVSGNIVDRNKAVFGINRKKLKGAMIAKLADDQSMIVTISVKVEEKMVPVVGVSLKRVDATEVGSIAQ